MIIVVFASEGGLLLSFFVSNGMVMIVVIVSKLYIIKREGYDFFIFFFMESEGYDNRCFVSKG